MSSLVDSSSICDKDCRVRDIHMEEVVDLLSH